MDYFYIFLAIIVIGLMALCIFVIGALFARHFILEAYADAKYDRMRDEYYRLAGVRQPSDPKPYFPPRIRTPRSRFLPGMGALDRKLKEGKRGIVMWKPEDRRKAV